MSSRPKVHAVIVLYNPEETTLRKTFFSLIKQVDKIYLINNTPLGKGIFPFCFHGRSEVVSFGENKGVAYAQNVGIRKSLENGADYILLSDQDTVYPDGYVKKILECFTDDKIAAVGPVFVDVYSGRRRFFITTDGKHFKKIEVSSGKQLVLQLISSGTIIKSSVIKTIGYMREDLFIDWVDLEWSWRAVSKGYKLLGNSNVFIYHCLGKGIKKFWGREIFLEDPFRYYYIIRNSVFLATKTDLLNRNLRMWLLLKSLGKIFVYSMLSDEHLAAFKNSIIGLYHGVIGKLGKFDTGDNEAKV